MKKKIIIIGSGIGGLAAAALLAKEGNQVTVFEKNEQPGGRASVLEEKGFRFDMGPSWYMMPEVFEKYFNEFQKTTADFFTLKQLTPQYRVFFEDKTHIDITGDVQKDRRTFEKLEPGAAKKFDQYLSESQKKYDIAMHDVLYKNIDSIKDMLSWQMAKEGSKLGIFLPMQTYIQKFFHHPKILQILEYNLVFLGCSPSNAPSLFSLMAHVDFNLKVWYPSGGIASIVNALVELGKMHNVQYHFDSPVDLIQVEGEKVTGVSVKKKFFPADIVVSNSEYAFTEDILSDQTKRTYSKHYWNRKIFTPSAFLLYLGVKGQIPELIHHTLYFGRDWKEHFRDVFDHPRWPVEPSIYINKTSATDKTVAPKNHENLMILVPVAPGLTENEHWKEKYAEYIISYIDSHLGTKIAKNIVYQKIFSVSDFQSRYNAYKGNALGGLAHTLFQSALWRPKNQSKKLSNLYFVGANTNPGIGVPPAMISAHLLRDKIITHHANT